MTGSVQAYEVAADAWLDGIEPRNAPNGQVAERITRGSHVMIHPDDDRLAARCGGWANLRPATGQHGVNDGRGVATQARQRPRPGLG